MDKENKLILYKDDEGKVNVNVRFADEDVWLTRENLAEIYATTPQNISLHVGNIYQDQELNEEGTRKKFFLVRQEGKRQVQREIDHYNLDMIIALGYRVQSPIAVRFRRWATQRLHEYIQKGFTLDDERLKQDRSSWQHFQLRSGTNWQRINKEINKEYQINAYRVLLTRARQGMVIVVPNGDDSVPPDETRKPEWYDGIYDYLKSVGIKEL